MVARDDPSSQKENPLDKLSGGVVVQIGSRRKQQQQQQPTELPRVDSAEEHFLTLGHDRGVFFFFSVHSGQIINLRANQLGQRANLMMLAPLEWWETTFGSLEYGLTKRNQDMAVDWVIRACLKEGVFQPHRIRGLGVWLDQGRVVYHAGNRLVVDGVVTPLHQFESQYLYEAASSLPITDIQLPESQRTAFLRLCRSLNWRNPIYGDLLAGWIVVSMANGALSWRPHGWLSGPSNCGKSWTASYIIRRALGPYAIAVTAGTTEPAIRQWLRIHALSVIYDEAEGVTKKDADIMQALLTLIRQASFGDSGEIMKGGSDGVANSFLIRSSFFLASIVPQIKQTADERRISVLELKPNLATQETKQRFSSVASMAEGLFSEENHFPERLHTLVYRNFHTLQKNIAIFQRELAVRVETQRFADQLAPMLAGLALLMDTETPISTDAAKADVDRVSLTDLADAAEAKEEEKVVNYILESIIEVHQETGHSARMSIGEIVRIAASERFNANITKRDAMEALERKGIKVNDTNHHLIISNTHSGIAEILDGTPWGTGWHRLIKRIEGAKTYESPQSFSGSRSRATSIPLKPLV